MSPVTEGIEPAELRSLRELMDATERLMRRLEAWGMPYWLDWGTLLGILRHQNPIPWDYDADFCMMKPDYDRLVAEFAARNGVMDGLRMDTSAYGEPESCCLLALGDPLTAEIGIDIVAYVRRGSRLESLMSPAVIAEYPGDYDFEEASLFPLTRLPFLGRLAPVPRDPEGRVRHHYGSGWELFPEGCQASLLTRPPFKRVAQEAKEGQPRLTAAGASRPVAGKEAGEVFWLLSPEHQAQVAGPPGSWRELSFTELVFQSDLALWGHLQVAVLEPEVGLLVPPGWDAWRSPSWDAHP